MFSLQMELHANIARFQLSLTMHADNVGGGEDGGQVARAARVVAFLAADKVLGTKSCG